MPRIASEQDAPPAVGSEVGLGGRQQTPSDPAALPGGMYDERADPTAIRQEAVGPQRLAGDLRQPHPDHRALDRSPGHPAPGGIEVGIAERILHEEGLAESERLAERGVPHRDHLGKCLRAVGDDLEAFPGAHVTMTSSETSNKRSQGNPTAATAIRRPKHLASAGTYSRSSQARAASAHASAAGPRRSEE